ncbi:helix-turn-helix transcriptional regulator [Bacteroides sp. 51]|uniref:helix-turn-helix domain-containing protein n=1 Tax=Bacteroides sp. 51 TaxID=2302938 RepID=UPI0013D43C80|nr:helix-turn-helix transcriptional regulator [Bacteroides sp. 51]NDV82593.1 XRE family transcriptional regulator [Bacteroides sp. 51]
MDIKDRIRLIMEKENMIAGTFADSIGVQQSTLSHVINGRNRPSLDVVMKIHQRYNYIKLEWLLYGIGDMINENSSASEVLSPSASINPSYSDHSFPSLFDQNPENAGVEPENSKNRKEIALETPVLDTKPAVIQEIKYIERPHRKITEIRIFFDDNTYETFRGEK